MFRSIVTLMALLTAGMGSSSAQECLHGPSEVPAQRARRQQALRLAHQINLAETATLGQYRPLSELATVPRPPQGFDLRLSTDGVTYAFVIKDKTDPCGYAVFSDQDGTVYEAAPSREVVLLPASSN